MALTLACDLEESPADEASRLADEAALPTDEGEPLAVDADDPGLRQGPLRAAIAKAQAGLPWTLPTPPPDAVTQAPLPAAYCQINVEGVLRDTETDYIPRVVMCENGGANLEALKAQAIAARSVAYYAMDHNGTICDSQGCQVYTCASQPSALAYQAAAETVGQYLSFDNTIKGRVLTYAFYVAGDKNQTAACTGVDPGAGTEKFVTYNEGKTWTDVAETTLGFQFKDPNAYGYGQNRGCMSQWSARCLENTKGYDHKAILRYFYGDDIDILQATGPCVGPVGSPPQGALEEAGCQGIVGWAHDEDLGAAPLEVRLSFGGELDAPGSTQVELVASAPRPDLCDTLGSCDHGFSLSPPRSLRDGQPHAVYAYVTDDGEGEGESDWQALDGSPATLLCDPPQPPPGIRRAVDPPSIDAWGFRPFWQLAVLDAPTLGAIPEWEPLLNAPQLIRASGEPEVWLVDRGWRRAIPSEAVASAWGFDLEGAAEWPPAEVMALPEGTDVRPQVFLVSSADDPAIYLIDDPQCPEGGIPGDPLCPGDGDESESAGESESDGSDTGDTGGGETGGTGGTGDSSGDSGGTGDDDPDGVGGESLGGQPSLPPGYGDEDEGCGCAASSGRSGAGSTLLLVGGLLLGLRRRRDLRDLRDFEPDETSG